MQAEKQGADYEIKIKTTADSRELDALLAKFEALRVVQRRQRVRMLGWTAADAAVSSLVWCAILGALLWAVSP